MSALGRVVVAKCSDTTPTKGQVVEVDMLVANGSRPEVESCSSPGRLLPVPAQFFLLRIGVRIGSSELLVVGDDL